MESRGTYEAVDRCINAAIISGAYRATKFISPKHVVKATRRHKIDRRASRTEFVVTIGAPNYLERIFIKKAQKAGETFPIKKVQLKWPSRRSR